MGQAALHRRPCSMQSVREGRVPATVRSLRRVGERQIGQHSDPGPPGHPRQPCHEPGDGSADPRKEFSFLVEGLAGPWKRIDRAEMVRAPWTAACFHAVGELRVAHGKPRAAFPWRPVRTKNRSRSPGPRASGQWNNVAKGSRQNGGVTWEEALALRAGRGGAGTVRRWSARSVGLSGPGERARPVAVRPPFPLGCKQPP